MAMIDFSFINGFVSSFNEFFTKLARSEQMKESDDSKEDISSTVVKAVCTENELTLLINTNKNNDTSVWMHNYYTMAKTLFPDQVREYLNVNPEPLIEQIISPLVANFVGGVKL